MGKFAVDIYYTVQTQDIETAVPVVANVTPSSTTYSGAAAGSSCDGLVESLAWADTYYDDEPDIVAVFDMDQQAIRDYQFYSTFLPLGIAISCFVLAVLLHFGLDLFALASLYYVAFGFFCTVALHAFKKYLGSRKSNIHVAVSTSSIRYDQENPPLSTTIALSKLTSCSVMEKKFRRFLWSGQSSSIHLVLLHLAGSRVPKIYVGLKDPKAFVHLAVSMTTRSASSPSAIVENTTTAIDGSQVTTN